MCVHNIKLGIQLSALLGFLDINDSKIHAIPKLHVRVCCIDLWSYHEIKNKKNIQFAGFEAIGMGERKTYSVLLTLILVF